MFIFRLSWEVNLFSHRVLTAGLSMIPPATPMNYISWVIVKYYLIQSDLQLASFLIL